MNTLNVDKMLLSTEMAGKKSPPKVGPGPYGQPQSDHYFMLDSFSSLGLSADFPYPHGTARHAV